jgi:hypothetical protein
MPIFTVSNKTCLELRSSFGKFLRYSGVSLDQPQIGATSPRW